MIPRPRRRRRLAGSALTTRGPFISNTVTVFTPFERLPKEIKIIIYKEALSAIGPRIITIGVKEYEVLQADLDPDFNLLVNKIYEEPDLRTDDAIFTFERPRVIQTIPALLHTSKMARDLALRRYRFAYSNQCEDKSICIDFNKDTLHFTTSSAWELFTRQLGVTRTAFVRRTVARIHKDSCSQLTDRYNYIFRVLLRQETPEVPREISCIDDMAENLRILAVCAAALNTLTQSQLPLERFWKLNMLCIKHHDLDLHHMKTAFPRPTEPESALDPTEVSLIQEWRKRSSGVQDDAEWRSRKQDFNHIDITLPSIRFLGNDAMMMRESLGRGFDMDFQGQTLPPIRYHALLNRS
ncbi:hypothetical protein DSL72_001383 [Monilinia vaccinii-corymbosi]|uniref:2EXR domain-containing protein n=1 Tax=Monilinia vaccinii-corymbosi TaxID=61207 RepID=A0A8A3P5W2_9HELO|nr:hypothetical protein DSL72_001383 [Monilinia vaccinii-corymbosi]